MREPSDAHPTDTVAPDAARAWSGPGRLAPGALVGARYEIRSVLGSGGTSIVYLAYDRLTKREVALKVLRPERLTANALVRLRREANAARDVAHPNLIRVFELGTSDELTWLAMERVDGETLRERLKRGPLPVEEAVRIATALLGGLGALHEAGLLHRDVKPGNVLLAADGTIKLADLGLVRRWESDETRATESEAVIGTFEYLSPEQAMGEELDVRSDLYSLGVVLFEMLAGRLPHEGKSSLGTLLASLRQPVPELRSLRPEVPSWLAALAARLLVRQRDQRYENAGAVLHDLDREAVARPRRAASRRRSLAAAATLALAAAAAVGWLEWQSGFAGIVADSPSSVRAVDRRGRVLWRHEGVAPDRNYPLVRRADGRRTLIAALFDAEGVEPTAERQTLRLLDPENGRTIQKLQMPSAGDVFPGMTDRYGRRAFVVDLNDDGADEAMVTFVHSPYWPSFSVLCEPVLGRCRFVFVGAGHHWPVGAADVDGDGRKELILLGTANRMGMLGAVAAVRVRPWIGEIGNTSSSPTAAQSPDEFRTLTRAGDLAWYALLPPMDAGAIGDGARIDAANRTITLELWRSGPRRIGFDGFLVSDASELPLAERSALRTRAYESLRQFGRQIVGGRAEAALPLAESALADAELAGDSMLAEWSARQAARGRIEAGRLAAAEELLAQWMERSIEPADVAWEAARAYHLRGDLELAAGWYERGLAVSEEIHRGRAVEDFLEGLVFALFESGRPDAAREVIRRWSRSFEIPAHRAPNLERWIGWRLGEAVPPGPAPGPGAPDFERYLHFELEWLAGAEPLDLIERLRSAQDDVSDGSALLVSLEAEALAALGRLDEARARAREALTRTRADATRSVYERAHLALVEERAVRLGAL